MAEQQIQHFSHKHPLIFKKEQNDSGLVFCSVCEDPVLGSSYTCNQCSPAFILHKSCADKLTPEIHNPIHPKHPLSLHPPQNGNFCSDCYQPCSGFIYYCHVCKFGIDLKCASKWENYCHDHKFTVLKNRTIKFTCDVCGKDGNVDLYLCGICQLMVHKKCSWLPRRVKIGDHNHRLKLTWRFEDIYPKKQRFCSFCNRHMDQSRAVYYCHECCSYVAHNSCATKETTPDDDPQHKNNQTKSDPAAQINQTKSEPAVQINQTKSEQAVQINHFSHQHRLTLITDHHEVYKDKDKDNDHLDDRIYTCNGCMRPITTTEAFYRCAGQEESSCHFFLHLICAQFDRKRRFSLHSKHELTLLPRAPSIDGVFRCYVCNTFSQGFGYYCDNKGCDVYFIKEEGFYLDLHCSILWEYNKSLKHEAHHHDLRFIIKQGSSNQCKGCGASKHIGWFSCTILACNFNLCIPCVKLPLTARHRYDDHHLKLTYRVTDMLAEHYCEICEGPRIPKHWFYSCSDCDFHCHPHCILGRYPQVKLGGAYKHDTHPHPVTLVYKERSVIPSDKREHILDCQACGEPCEGLVWECSKCNVNIHRKGYCRSTKEDKSVSDLNSGLRLKS
ncbi:PREDICTED: Cysteine/Histidine-rich C1 domain [Prunus dulcis]|uniref:PREDICTED: Cysteine/Histidine-rich C1 domain n=1 Tax=Prunus dulcis TaxID=3755 RepID=A0A5E4END9_PRUDU|nr:PREDICTED: Cysteine/Histidine-rich C1 domain [Prunus dulcis]